MPRYSPISSNARGLALLVAPTVVLALSGCTSKDDQSAGEGDKADAGETGDAPNDDNANGPSAPQGPAAAGSSALAPAPRKVLAHDKGLVLGHVAIVDAPGLLAAAKEQLSTPESKGFFDEAALRSLAAMALDKRSNIAMHVDIAKPFGCAVVDFKKHSQPVICTFGYQGGLNGVLTDLGDQGMQPDAKGHSAYYRIEGEDVYLDEIGEHIAIASDPALFDPTKAYLEQNIIGRTKDVARGQIEAIGYPADAFDIYKSEIDGLIDEAVNETAPVGQTGTKEFDEVAKIWQDYNRKSTRQTFESFREYQQISMHMAIEPEGLSFGMGFVVEPGSETAKTLALASGGHFDGALAGLAPANTIAVLGQYNPYSPDTLKLPRVQEGLEAMVQSWAKLSHGDPKEVRAAFDAFVEEERALYGEQSMAALVHQPGAPIAMSMAARMRDGKNGRDAWKAWSERFTPDAVLGPKLAEFVTWEFTPDYRDAGGSKVDRWVIKPTDKALAEIEKDLSPGELADIQKVWGDIQLTIDRVETNGVTVFTMAPKAEDAFADRVVAAINGTENLASDTGLKTVASRDPSAQVTGGLNVKNGANWLRDLGETVAPELSEIPSDLGNDLSDVYGSARYEENFMWLELMIGQPFVDQLRKKAREAAKGGL